MKKSIFFLLIFMMMMYVGSDRADAKKLMELKIGNGEASVNQLEGSAQVLAPGQKKWRPLKLKDILMGGYEVQTGSKTRLELLMPDYSVIRFANNSHFKILQIETGDENKPRNVKVHMAIGRSWANLSRAVGKKGQFDLSCENAVAGVRGTIYRMNVWEDKSALVRVYDGEVSISGGGKEEERKPVMGPPQKISGPKAIPGPKKVSMEEWTVIIQAMQQIQIGADGTAYEPREFTDQEDSNEWVKWNKSQDNDLKAITE